MTFFVRFGCGDRRACISGLIHGDPLGCSTLAMSLFPLVLWHVHRWLRWPRKQASALHGLPILDARKNDVADQPLHAVLLVQYEEARPYARVAILWGVGDCGIMRAAS